MGSKMEATGVIVDAERDWFDGSSHVNESGFKWFVVLEHDHELELKQITQQDIGDDEIYDTKELASQAGEDWACRTGMQINGWLDDEGELIDFVTTVIV